MKPSILTVLQKKINMEEVSIEETPYIFNNVYVPRVTNILSLMLSEEYLMSWANYMGFKRINYKTVRDEAAEKGTYTHNFIEGYLSKSIEPDMNTVEKQYQDEVAFAFNSFLKWWTNLNANNTVEVVMQEQPLVCQYFGGTLDILLKINGKYYLFDFKTSNHPSYKYFLQLAAYRYMLKLNYNIDLDGCGVLMLSKNQCEFQEIFANFEDPFYLNFINSCQEAFFSLVYSYYNRIYVENTFKDVMRRNNEQNDYR